MHLFSVQKTRAPLAMIGCPSLLSSGVRSRFQVVACPRRNLDLIRGAKLITWNSG